MLNVNTAPSFPPIVEASPGMAVREKIIQEGLKEYGGIGWSILGGVGVKFPLVAEFSLSDCMREAEIQQTLSLLEQGKKVWWDAGEGYGKTTFLSELETYIDAKNIKSDPRSQLQVFDIDHIIRGTAADMRPRIEHETERIEYYLGSGKAKATSKVYVLDSADFLWERVKGESVYGPTIKARIEFIKKLLHSDCKMIMTSHDQEPKNKAVDDIAKSYFESMLRVYGVERKKLSPLYPEEKMKAVLERVGFPPATVDGLFRYVGYPARHHGMMTNYVLGVKDNYRLPDLLSYIDSLARLGLSEEEVAAKLVPVFNQRNERRIKDWL